MNRSHVSYLLAALAVALVCTSVGGLPLEAQGAQPGSPAPAPAPASPAEVPSCRDNPREALRWAVEHLPFGVVLGSTQLDQIRPADLATAVTMPPRDGFDDLRLWGEYNTRYSDRYPPALRIGFRNSVAVQVLFVGRLPQIWRPVECLFTRSASSTERTVLSRLDSIMRGFHVQTPPMYYSGDQGVMHMMRTSTVRIGNTDMFVDAFRECDRCSVMDSYQIWLNYGPDSW